MSMPNHADNAGPGYDLESLTREQAAFAAETEAFIAGAEEAFRDMLERFNGSSDVEVTEFQTETAHYHIAVARGGVIEKAGLMKSVVTASMPPYIKGPIWNRWVSIDIHPKTPLVGMLHLTLTVQFTEAAPPSVGGWVDMMPAVWLPEDLAALKGTTDSVFDRHGVDPTPYRELICKGYADEIDRKWRRQPSCGGASFYTRPPLPATPVNLALVSETFLEFLETYLEILNRRRDEAHSAEDVAAQDEMRRRWLQDQLFSDPFSSKLVPYEAWSVANMPPVIKF